LSLFTKWQINTFFTTPHNFEECTNYKITYLQTFFFNKAVDPPTFFRNNGVKWCNLMHFTFTSFRPLYNNYSIPKFTKSGRKHTKVQYTKSGRKHTRLKKSVEKAIESGMR
jgi:hypothetical protein